ncbi:uncharacterized protein BDR25DRAFT_360876 [Lindgomyces ingoldianus]|uniref:Uncharacterized protein n=1 Tax=Lindgomyces ingoldianus TaxID=673940 RepID=A0ACB6QFH1_9PLEO|nr:uncharacterized protein BDR25DRAFT_360876 [Lindgomyces ingoldianus]KAF2465235.1 hypothetical protein BDR25DRAFT_360876 [Lindgomyces ingoldianus]
MTERKSFFYAHGKYMELENCFGKLGWRGPTTLRKRLTYLHVSLIIEGVYSLHSLVISFRKYKMGGESLGFSSRLVKVCGKRAQTVIQLRIRLSRTLTECFTHRNSRSGPLHALPIPLQALKQSNPAFNHNSTIQPSRSNLQSQYSCPMLNPVGRDASNELILLHWRCLYAHRIHTNDFTSTTCRRLETASSKRVYNTQAWYNSKCGKRSHSTNLLVQAKWMVESVGSKATWREIYIFDIVNEAPGAQTWRQLLSLSVYRDDVCRIFAIAIGCVIAILPLLLDACLIHIKLGDGLKGESYYLRYMPPLAAPSFQVVEVGLLKVCAILCFPEIEIVGAKERNGHGFGLLIHPAYEGIMNNT